MIFRKAEPEQLSLFGSDSTTPEPAAQKPAAPPRRRPPTPEPVTTTPAAAFVPDVSDVRKLREIAEPPPRFVPNMEWYTKAMHGESVPDAAVIPRVYTGHYNDPDVKKLMQAPESEREYLFVPISRSRPAAFEQWYKNAYGDKTKESLKKVTESLRPASQSLLEQTKAVSTGAGNSDGEHEAYHAYQASQASRPHFSSDSDLVDYLHGLGATHDAQLKAANASKKHKGIVLLCWEDLNHTFDPSESKPHFCHRRAVAGSLQSEIETRLQRLQAADPDTYASLLPKVNGEPLDAESAAAFNGTTRVLRHYMTSRDSARPSLPQEQLRMLYANPSQRAEIPVFDMSRSERSRVNLERRTAMQVVPPTGWSVGIATTGLPVYEQPAVPPISAIGVNNSNGSIFSQKADVLINFASSEKPSQYSGIEKEFMERFPGYKRSYERWASKGVNGFKPGQAFWFQPKSDSGDYDGPAILTLMTRSSGYAASGEFGQALGEARKILDKQFPKGARVVMPHPEVMHSTIPENFRDLILENFSKKFSPHSLQICADLPTDQTIQTSSAQYPRWSENSFSSPGRGDDYREDISYPLDPSAVIMFGGSYLPESKSNNETRKLSNFSGLTPIGVNVAGSSGSQQFSVRTAEHLYQMIKASFIIPPAGTKNPEAWKVEHQRKIQLAESAAVAKRLNRGMSLDPSFFKEGAREAAMEFAVISRAFSDVDFYNALLATGDAPIVEIAPLQTGQTPFGEKSGIESTSDLIGHPEIRTGAFQKELQTTDWLEGFKKYVSKGKYSQYINDLKADGKTPAQIAAISLEIRKKHVEELKRTPGFQDIVIGFDGSTIEGISEEKRAELRKSEGSLQRVMVGNHGIYLELSEPDVSANFGVKKHIQYNEYRNGNVKYYHQFKTVNYAEYQIGNFYSSINHYLKGQPAKDAEENWTRDYAPLTQDSELDRSGLFWGTAICATETHGDVLRGNNMLGRILTRVRDDIKKKTILLDREYEVPDELADCKVDGASLAPISRSTHYSVQSALSASRTDELSQINPVEGTYKRRQAFKAPVVMSTDFSSGTGDADTSAVGAYDTLHVEKQYEALRRDELYKQSFLDFTSKGKAILGKRNITDWNKQTGRSIANIRYQISQKAMSFGIPPGQKNDFILSCMNDADTSTYLSEYSDYMSNDQKKEMQKYGTVLRTHVWNAALVNSKSYFESIRRDLQNVQANSLYTPDIINSVLIKIAEKIATLFDPDFVTQANQKSSLGGYIQGLFTKKGKNVSGFMQGIMNKERYSDYEMKTQEALRTLDRVNDAGLSLYDREFDKTDDFEHIDPYDQSKAPPVEISSLSRQEREQAAQISEQIKQAEKQQRESGLTISSEVDELRDVLRVAVGLSAAEREAALIEQEITSTTDEGEKSKLTEQLTAKKGRAEKLRTRLHTLSAASEAFPIKDVIEELQTQIALKDGKKNRDYQREVIDLQIRSLQEKLRSLVSNKEVINPPQQVGLQGLSSWKEEIYNSLDNEPDFLNADKKLFKNAIEELVNNNNDFSATLKLLASINNTTEDMVRQKLIAMFDTLKGKKSTNGKPFFGKYDSIRDLWTALKKN